MLRDVRLAELTCHSCFVLWNCCNVHRSRLQLQRMTPLPQTRLSRPLLLPERDGLTSNVRATRMRILLLHIFTAAGF